MSSYPYSYTYDKDGNGATGNIDADNKKHAEKILRDSIKANYGDQANKIKIEVGNAVETEEPTEPVEE